MSPDAKRPSNAGLNHGITRVKNPSSPVVSFPHGFSEDRVRADTSNNFSARNPENRRGVKQGN